MIGHIKPQCSMLKREQNHIARSLPKKPSGPKHIVYLRFHCSKFQALKRIKRKEKLKFIGSCALQAKPNLIESGKLLKHVVNALTSLSICISNSHSHETLIPKNYFV